MKTQEKYLDAGLECIEEAINFIDENLEKIKVKRKERIKAELLAEEFLAHTINNKTEEDSDKIRVAVSKKGAHKSVIVSYKGKQIKNIENIGFEKDLSFSDMSADTEAFIRKKILSSNNDSFTCGYKNGINKISIAVQEPVTLGLKEVFLTFLLAFVAGLIIRFILPENVGHFISHNILHTIEDIFLNAFKLITGPVVFFSVAASVSSYSNLKELGKTASRLIVLIIITAAATMIIGFGISAAISPGDTGELASMASTQVEKAEDINFTEVITGLIPSNIITPFLELNTFHIIIIALLIGIAAGKLGEKSNKVSEFLSNASNLFFKITEFLTKFLHIMIFASITALVVTIKHEATGSVLKLLLCIILGFALTFLFYNILLLITTKTSPFKFFKKAYPVWVNAFSLHSSNAAISFTMDTCKKNLKISPKIYSFSIPLSASLNMDDLTVVFSISVLSFAKLFGVGLKPTDYVVLVFMIVLLAISTPGMPSGGTISFTFLLSQFGIPMEALAIFISINAILDPFASGNNVFGNVVKTYIISKHSSDK